jgi:hypothetical protein
MYRITHFACLLFGAVAFAHGAHLMAAADPMPTEADAAATPNHDPRHAAETVAANPEMILAEPVDAAPSTPSFVTVDKMLYARADARLRAGPSTAAGILAKLPADAPLHAVARSADGAWWKVSVADKRVGYVYRNVVTNAQAAKMVLLPVPTEPETMPVAAATPAPAPVRRSPGVLGFVTDAMNWLADKAGTTGTGRPSPKMTRSQH